MWQKTFSLRLKSIDTRASIESESMGHAHKEQRFDSYGCVPIWIIDWFASKGRRFFLRGIHKLAERWKSCSLYIFSGGVSNKNYEQRANNMLLLVTITKYGFASRGKWGSCWKMFWFYYIDRMIDFWWWIIHLENNIFDFFLWQNTIIHLQCFL